MTTNRQTVINVFPQCSECWLFIAIACVAWAVAWGVSRTRIAEEQAKAPTQQKATP